MSVLDTFRLDGKVALVTGANSGIGKACARGLAEAGARLALFDRSDMSDLPNTLGLPHQECLTVQGDVGESADVERAVREATSRLGRVDILLNSAGIVEQVAPAHQLPLEQWNDVIRIDLTGTFLFCKEVLKGMVERGSGKIINVASIWGYVGAGMFPAAGYAAAKGGVLNLTRELGKQYAPLGVQINAIAPGFFSTEIAGGVYHDPDFVEAAKKTIPMGRIGDPAELMGTVVYLASEASSYIAGETVVVDGGFLSI